MRPPPRWAKTLIERVVRPSLREPVLDDLERLFEHRVRTDGPRAARRWYRGQALRTLVAHGPRRLSPAQATVDLRHALRSLRRAPGPLLLSTISLSLGIAATATMISVVDAVDFRPLPYRDADRLVQLGRVSGSGDSTPGPVSRGLFREWQDRTRSYEALAAASPIAAALADDQRSLEAARVTGDFFAALGVTPVVGRTFTAAEVREGTRVLVISHALWQARFGGDRNVVGRTVPVSWAGEFRSVAAEPFTVVGVLPPSARYPRGSDVWLPASGGFGGTRLDPMLTVLGRLGPSASLAGARAELDAVSARLASEEPDAFEGLAGAVVGLRDAIRTRADSRGTSARFLLLSVAALVLVLATVNTAIVFLVRVARQEHDLVVRTALGAPRWRLVTLMLGQSLLVSMGAGALGVLLSYWGIRLADARLSVANSGLAPVLDWRVVTVGLCLSFLAGLVVGTLPAARLGRTGLRDDLGARTAAGKGAAAGGGRLQGTLIVAQVACALVLLTGAAVLARDLVDLVTRDPGFEADRLLVAGLPLTASHADAVAVADRVAGLPGVDGAAIGGLPATGYVYRLYDGRELAGPDRPFSYRVSSGYFRTLGIPLLAGRPFSPADRAGAAPVAIVSRGAARAWWPGDAAVGKRLFMGTTGGTGGATESVGGDGDWVTIVGVAGDERIDRDMRSPLRPVLYRPWGQLASERRRIRLFATTTGEPEALLPEVREILRQARESEGWQGDSVTTMAAVLGDTLELQRFRASALGLFSLFGLLLASLGIYGAVAAAVAQRTPEIGVRVALGASSTDVLKLVTGQGLGLAAVGIGLGLAGAFAAQRLLESLVVTGGALDPVVTLTAGAFLAAVVVVACWVPGRRATRVDPTIALRE